MQSAGYAPRRSARESHRVRDQLHQRRLCKRRYSRLTYSKHSDSFFGIVFESTRLSVFDPHQIGQTISDTSVDTRST